MEGIVAILPLIFKNFEKQLQSWNRRTWMYRLESATKSERGLIKTCWKPYTKSKFKYWRYICSAYGSSSIKNF